MEAASLLRELKEGRIMPREAFPQLAEHVSVLFVPEQELRIRTESGEGLVVFTSLETAVLFEKEVKVKEKDALAFVQQALRDHHEMILFNPNHESMLVLHKNDMKLLMREYAMNVLKRRGGAYVPMRPQGEPLFIPVPDGGVFLPAYLDEREGNGIHTEYRCVPMNWHTIAEYCRIFEAEAVFLQMGYPEQIGIQVAYLEQLKRSESPVKRMKWAGRFWFLFAFILMALAFTVGLNEWLIAIYAVLGVVILVGNLVAERRRNRVKRT
ncbi:hypothetical protein ACFQPF_05430 [Fictibacillus iocasae]|uniref:SseB protein N-terminal domain-containing protein n=1 Tax=Fictibacillus iocasae TaxID=2715437 RepID=A0ABW2NNP4_9BACL